MYFGNSTLVFLNGDFVLANNVSTGLYNQTLHYGNGVFEGIRSYNSTDGVRIFKAKEHFERLIFSAEKMHIKLNYTCEEFEKAAYKLLEKNNLTDAYIRPIVYLGENMSLTPAEEVNVAILAWKWGSFLGDDLLSIMLSSYERPNPKSCHIEAKVVGHYANSVLASTEAKLKGYDEALLTDMNGFIAEGPGANFFMEKDGRLITAPEGNILPGITRATVFEIAKELNVEIEEKFFRPDDIYDADIAFFCGTATEIAGIKKYNDFEFPMKWDDSISQLIQRAYKRRVTSYEHKDLYI
jgi:branched-chain amino acid aminotransferase